jgi:hypothetical protein
MVYVLDQKSNLAWLRELTLFVIAFSSFLFNSTFSLFPRT